MPGANCRQRWSLLASGCTLALLFLAAVPAVAESFSVDSLGTAGDDDVGDGLCATSDGECTLRAAIEEANDDAEADTITFNIDSLIVPVLTPGPLEISQPLTLNGTTQSQGWIALDFDGGEGLTISGGGTTVRGLAVYGYSTFGLALVGAEGNRVYGCHLGTGASGTLDQTDSAESVGVLISDSANNVIGGIDEDDRNVVAGNGRAGVEIVGAGSSLNSIKGNHIGLDATGTFGLPNAIGVWIHDNAGNNVVGGSANSSRNLIGGNASHGVQIGPDTEAGPGNRVEGNLIGLRADGTAVGNGADGVHVSSASNTTIGGLTAAASNIVSANGRAGVRVSRLEGAIQPRSTIVRGNTIGLGLDGSVLAGNTGPGVWLEGDSNALVGGTADGASNTISGNLEDGVRVGDGSEGATVEGNTIGASAAGTADRGNGAAGVAIRGGTGALVGGGNEQSANHIAGNVGDGVLISGATSCDNRVYGNLIGTTSDGLATLANDGFGVQVSDGCRNQVGGVETGRGNLISGNRTGGVSITGANATDNILLANLIGVDATGGQSLQNAGDGIIVSDGAVGTVVGGASGSAGNTVAGNTGHGIHLSGADGTTIEGNHVGTGLDGLGDLGNLMSGIAIVDSTDTQIGGLPSGARNIVSGNQLNGLLLSGTTEGTECQGNIFGGDITEVGELANGLHGVAVEGTANGNRIGGVQEGAGNLVVFNTRSGVSVAGAAVGNSILGNQIHSNGDLGIELGGDGADENDEGDLDGGANAGQNFPEIIWVRQRPATVAGRLNSVASASVRVEVFAAPVGDPSGRGQGPELLGTIDLETGDTGEAAFLLELDEELPVGRSISATATGPDGSTSEFAINGTVGSPLNADLAVSQRPTPEAPEVGDELTFSIEVVNRGPEPVHVTVVDHLPSLAAFVSFSAGQAVCTLDGLRLVCDLGLMDSGGSAQLEVTVLGGRIATITNRVVAHANVRDPIPEDNESILEVFVNSGRGIDLDGDGEANADDNCPHTSNPQQEDLDLDGVGDVCDDDVDGDGVADALEEELGLTVGDADSDSDGISDGEELGDETSPRDTDDDGIIDALDTDSDGDGVDDEVEAGDGDVNTSAADVDGDGVPDYRDDDSDGDGVLDGVDNCRIVENEDQAEGDGGEQGEACLDDEDGDGVMDADDNCALVGNPTQGDRDEDGDGDACDGDNDNDGVPDARDNCVVTPNTDQDDSNDDGIGDACAAGGGDDMGVDIGQDAERDVASPPSASAGGGGGCDCATVGGAANGVMWSMALCIGFLLRRRRR